MSAVGVARRGSLRMRSRSLLLPAAAVVLSAMIGLAGGASLAALGGALAAIIVIPLIIWLFASERYHATLAVFTLYLGLADGVVKLGTGSSVATLGRDILLYAIVFGAIARMAIRKSNIVVPPLTGFVLAWIAVCVVQVFNPQGSSLTHSFVSLRQDLEFVPLFFLGFFVLRSERRLTGLLVLLLIIGAANGIASFAEANVSPATLAKVGPGYANLELGTGTRVARTFVNAAGQAEVRPPGLGGSDGFGGFVGFIALPGVIVLLTGLRRPRWAWFLIPIAAIGCLLAVISSQTRFDIVEATLALFVFLLLTLTSRRGILVLFASAVIGLVGVVAIVSFTSSHSNRYSTLAPDKIFGTAVSVRSKTLADIPLYLVRYPLGAGLGRVGPAGESSVGGNAHALNGEDEVTFLIVETGVPGLLVMILFTLAALRVGWRLRRVADPGLQKRLMVLTAVLISLAVAWFIGPITSDSPGAPFLWMGAGTLGYWYREVRAGRVPLRPRRFESRLRLR